MAAKKSHCSQIWAELKLLWHWRKGSCVRLLPAAAVYSECGEALEQPAQTSSGCPIHGSVHNWTTWSGKRQPFPWQDWVIFKSPFQPKLFCDSTVLLPSATALLSIPGPLSFRVSSCAEPPGDLFGLPPISGMTQKPNFWELSRLLHLWECKTATVKLQWKRKKQKTIKFRHLLGKMAAALGKRGSQAPRPLRSGSSPALCYFVSGVRIWFLHHIWHSLSQF